MPTPTFTAGVISTLWVSWPMAGGRPRPRRDELDDLRHHRDQLQEEVLELVVVAHDALERRRVDEQGRAL